MAKNSKQSCCSTDIESIFYHGAPRVLSFEEKSFRINKYREGTEVTWLPSYASK
jgi:hypothetical protein